MTSLAFEIDYKNARAGWINCCIIVDGVRHPIEASNVFPPFGPLLVFVRAIATGRLPARFSWDEEGPEAHFLATQQAEDSPLVHLSILYDKSDTPWLDADIHRETVVQAFLPVILDFVTHYKKALVEWYISREQVQNIQAVIARGMPLRSDANSPQFVDIRVESEYEIGYVEGHVFLKLSLFDEHQVNILLHDTHPFWPAWLAFVDQIAAGDLPAECQHRREVSFFPGDPPLVDFTDFRATRVANEDNVRLEVFSRWPRDEAFLEINEVVSRAQFTSEFNRSFETFLREKYQISPDESGKTFDLRTLRSS